MNVRVLIVDDEPLARRGVSLRLAEHPDITVIGECANGEDAIRSILALKPDLVFLDIQMPGMCGIEVLRSLPQGSIPCIIFLTAYDEYALAAFEVQALDYLLKPIDNVRFLIALERARRILALQQQDVLHSRFQKLLELHSERNDTGPAKRFAIRNGNQVAFVQSSEIDWIEAVGDYAGLHVGKKMHLLREPLHLLECRLDRAEFLRIHRSTIVKLDQITRIEPLANRDCRLTLQDGTHLRVSRTYSKPLHDLLRNRESATISL